MNAKLKSILHTAWTEPCHFFFWLALLSFMGLVAVGVGTTVARHTLLPAFFALGCALCFLVSLLAFILAWISPIRRLFSWLLRRRFLVLASLATLVALVYAVEDWRGRRAWQSFKRDREAKGERFDFASLAPPLVPPDENFFETPLWNDMHFVQTNGHVVWSDTNWGSRVIFNVYGPKDTYSPSAGDWLKPRRVDLPAWQAFYRGSDNVFPVKGGPATNYFPVANQPQSPAADVLLALSRFDNNRQLLIAAAARPRARFWTDYDAGYAALLPHLSRLKSCSQYLSLHANAALKAGDRETALEDVRLQFRLLDAMRDEPSIISHLVRGAILALALQPVWEGLADRQWTEADLNVIEDELGNLDFLAAYQLAMRGERACAVSAVDYVHKEGPFAFENLYSEREGQVHGDFGRCLAPAMFRLIPAGWFDQNKLSICRNFENYLFPLVDQERRIIPPDLSRQSASAIEKFRPRPYDVLSEMLLPRLDRAASRCARTQTSVDLARVACALERYRLANGQFPDALETLAPKCIPALPHDIINGQPLKYRRTDDGQFVLYSVGWNGTDDGGKVGLNKEGAPDWSSGDWVWRYPAR